MEVLNPLWVLEVLRRELELRGVSGREIDRRLRKLKRDTIRQALAEGREGRLSLEKLSAVLEAAEIDARAFLGLVGGGEAPLRSLVGILSGSEAASWSRQEKGLLAVAKLRRPRGGAGYSEMAERLRRVEELREEEPEAAEALAWQALELANEAGRPGAIAGALATLAGGSSRARARDLFEMVLEILGDDPPPGLLAGKVYGNLARVLLAAGYPRQALRLLRYRAYPDVDLHGGDGDDRALLFLAMFRAGRDGGELGFGIGCLEKAVGCGGERLRFVTLHLLAATILSQGDDLERAARHYDELLAMPHLAAAPPAARALAQCFRLAAHFRAGHLSAADLPGFERTWEENKDLLGDADRISFALDLVAFLRQLDRDDDAGQLLVYEWWTIINLEDDQEELQDRYTEACKASKKPLSPRIGVMRR